MVCLELFKKSFSRHLQYRAAHLINNIGSLVFGFMYIAIWQGVLEGKEHSSPYSVTEMTHYMAATQSLLMLSVFLTVGLDIPPAVRNGSISLQMARPVHYFLYVTSQEAGRLFYNLFFRSLPIALVFAVTVGYPLPDDPSTWLWGAVSVTLGVLIGLNLFYLIGISSCWTLEISGAHFINMTLMFALGGQMVPLDLLPSPLAGIALHFPFSGLIYYPVMVWLEKLPVVEALIVPLFWGVLLTLFNLWLTGWARRKLEVQGG
ncbi:ABC-2 type transport system permease protein [Melghirimyces profundicolus]|uniref:ABC-2 type transport system permease protein n=1 Tax=Melghirimyces profundicolus TaxID=1242148 RepID=A0A2T6BS48_9BACL|nr:ABC-2 family transporter protein [Melghirimyces profundicolus]PTX58874.1 ABC-2 type transport system permease protein [Melghirimyces profundicolus]